jgi:hypothetical protein
MPVRVPASPASRNLRVLALERLDGSAEPDEPAVRYRVLKLGTLGQVRPYAWSELNRHLLALEVGVGVDPRRDLADANDLRVAVAEVHDSPGVRVGVDHGTCLDGREHRGTPGTVVSRDFREQIPEIVVECVRLAAVAVLGVLAVQRGDELAVDGVAELTVALEIPVRAVDPGAVAQPAQHLGPPSLDPIDFQQADGSPLEPKGTPLGCARYRRARGEPGPAAHHLAGRRRRR